MLHPFILRGRRAALLLAAALAACEAPHRPPPGAGADDALSGVWSARLVMTTPLVGRAVTPDTVRGTITLLRDDRRGQVPGLGGAPTHVGAHTLHLDPYGIALPENVVPGVASRLLPGDSVEMAFELARADQAFTVRGRLAGDSITGRWHYSGHATGGAAGRAVLRRTR
jgi:hypothetical protein